MRLEEFEPKHILEYTPGDIESMRDALHEYTQLIESREAFERGYCVAHFYHTTDAIGLDYFEGHPCIKEYITSMIYGYTSESNKDDLQSEMTGETLFFLCAIMWPELKNDIVKACGSMVSFARSINDSSQMWITCEQPFGIEALALLAHVYPEYGYLLASFLVPYWDDEHMLEPLYRLGQWSDRLGITKDTIKAYCYCDNDLARTIMLGHDLWNGSISSELDEQGQFDLLSYMRKSPENYKDFVAVMTDRIRDRAFLGDELKDSRLFTQRVFEMLLAEYPCNLWDDDFDQDAYLLNAFIDTPADIAIRKMKDDIEQLLGHSIFSLEVEEAKKTKSKAETSSGISEIENSPRVRQVTVSESSKWEYIVRALFEEGEGLWAYVLSGENSSLLQAVEPITFDSKVIKTMKKIDESFDSIAGAKEFNKRIDILIKPYAKERRDIDYRQDGYNACEEILRLYDILHRALAYPVMNQYLIDYLTSNFENITPDILRERFPSDWKDEFYNALEQIKEIDSFRFRDHEKFERFYSLVNEERALALDELKDTFKTGKSKESSREVDSYFMLAKRRSTLALAMYLVYADNLHSTLDGLTDHAKMYVTEHLTQFILECLSSHGSWPDLATVDYVRDIEYDNDYQKNYKADVLSRHDLWTSFERYLKEGVFDGYYGTHGFNQALAYFTDHLEVEETKIGQGQPQYKIFDRDDSRFMINLLYWGVEYGQLSSHNLLKRALKICMHAAPLYVLKNLFSFESAFDKAGDLDQKTGALISLKEHGFPDSAYWITQLMALVESVDAQYLVRKRQEKGTPVEERYLQLLRLYFEDVNKEENQILSKVELQAVKDALQKGAERLPRKDKFKLLTSAEQIFKYQPEYQARVDEMLMDKVLREVETSAYDVTVFMDKVLAEHKTPVSERRISLCDMENELAIEALEQFAPKLLAQAEYEMCHKYFETKWYSSRIYVSTANEELEVLYNQDLVNLLYTELMEDKPLSRMTIDIFTIENCSEEDTDLFKALVQMGDKTFWADRIRKFLTYESDLSEVEALLMYGINDYDFFAFDPYDIDIGEAIMAVSPALRNRILHILGSVDFKKLDLAAYGNRKDYASILFDIKLDRTIFLKYLLYMEEKDLIRDYALKTNYSKLLNNLNISDQVKVINLVARYPQYHPMMIELKSHPSIKIKDTVEFLIRKYKIEVDESVKYKIVDYGEYKVDYSVHPFNPDCLNPSTELVARVGMYFGIRFTAVDPETAPEVSVHKVMVEHPYKDNTGDIGRTTSAWDQNGYSASHMFAGWNFENEDECLAGPYTFKILDTENRIMVEKTLYIIDNI